MSFSLKYLVADFYLLPRSLQHNHSKASYTSHDNGNILLKLMHKTFDESCLSLFYISIQKYYYF